MSRLPDVTTPEGVKEACDTFMMRGGKSVPLPDAEAFAAAMEFIANEVEDQERAHDMADELMCSVLAQLGYEGAVSVFRSMKKWYS